MKKRKRKIVKNLTTRRRIEREDMPTNYLKIKEIYSEGHLPYISHEYTVGKYNNKLITNNSFINNIIKIGDSTFNTKLENNLIYDTAFDHQTRLCLFIKDGSEADNIYDNIKYMPTWGNFYFNPLNDNYYINPLKGSINHALNTMEIIVNPNDSDNAFFNGINEKILNNSVIIFKTLEQKYNLYYNIDDILKLIKDKDYALDLLSKNNDIIDIEIIDFFNDYWKDDSQEFKHEKISNKLNKLLKNETFNKIFNYNPNLTNKTKLEELNMLDDSRTVNSDCNIIIATRQNIIGDIGDIIGKVLYNDIQTSVLSTVKEKRFNTVIFNDNWKYFNSNTHVLLGQSRSYRAITYWHLSDIDEILYNDTYDINREELKRLLMYYIATKLIQENDLKKLESISIDYIPGKNDNIYIY